MKPRKIGVLISGICVVCILGVLPFMAAHANPASSVADFYKSNSVVLICPFGPGGGSDYIARLFASYWYEVTGGAMVVKNMPGAGSITGANYSYKAKPDGLTLIEGGISATFVAPTLAKDPAVKYDITKINWIGGLCTEPWGFSIVAKQPYETIKDLQEAKGLRFPAMHPCDEHANNSALLIDVFNLDDVVSKRGFHQVTDFSILHLKCFILKGLNHGAP